MHVAELWRYPVKSLRGERLEAAEVRRDGFAGDRMVQVRRDDGELITARTRPRLLALDAVAAADGMPLVGGCGWDSAEAARAVRDAAGANAHLERSSERRFDDTPLLVTTDGALAALGADGRRLRPNIVVAGVEGLAERGWPGSTLVVGELRIAVEKLCERCVMTTFDPDTLAQDGALLRRINDAFEGRFALNCHVLAPGRIRVGEVVTMI